MSLVDTVRWRLKEFLKENGISTYALVHASDLAQNTVYAVVRGSTMHVRLDTLAGILGGLRKLTGRDVTLADVLVHEVTPDPGADADALPYTGPADVSAASSDPERKQPPGERAAPEKPESGPTPDGGEWLEPFLVAAKGQSPSAPPPGSFVLVELNGQVRPALTLTPADAATCNIVLLAPPAKSRTELTLKADKREGGLPVTSRVLHEVHTVARERIVGVVGSLHTRKLRVIRDAVSEFLMLGDGRTTRK
jgi:hypothetical protein